MIRCGPVICGPLSVSHLRGSSNYDPLKPGYASLEGAVQVLSAGGLHRLQACAQRAGSGAALFWGRCKLFAQPDERSQC